MIAALILQVSKMDKNYYEILGTKRNSSEEEIADCFRRLSLRWNPKLAKEDQKTAYYHFSQVCEAYDVLRDPVKRAYYDKYGWRKLTQQLYSDGNQKGGYKYANNPYEIFDSFFKSTSALDQILDKSINNMGSMFNHAFGGLNYQDEQIRADLVVEVPCSLNELYTGHPKEVQFTKKALNPDGRSLSSRTHKKLLQIKPGYGKTTILRFKQQGNQTIQRKISDLVFKISEKPHQHYSRSGNNLIYNAKISLASAISCEPLEIITLDNRKLRISLDQLPNPQTLKQIIGEGMPIQDTKNKGNLYIKFDIQFPKNLSQPVKEQLRKLLS